MVTLSGSQQIESGRAGQTSKAMKELVASQSANSSDTTAQLAGLKAQQQLGLNPKDMPINPSPSNTTDNSQIPVNFQPPNPQTINVPQTTFPNKRKTEIPVVSDIANAAELSALERQKSNLINKISKGEATSQEIRQATGRFQLDAIDMEIIKSGQAQISKTGQFIEGLPFIPKELHKFIPAFTTPSKKVKDTQDLLSKTKENILLWSDLAKSNPATASSYISLINDAEAEVQKMESRIKLLAIQSPDLQANPEQILSLQKDILNTNTIIEAKKQELTLLGFR